MLVAQIHPNNSDFVISSHIPTIFHHIPIHTSFKLTVLLGVFPPSTSLFLANTCNWRVDTFSAKTNLLKAIFFISMLLSCALCYCTIPFLLCFWSPVLQCIQNIAFKKFLVRHTHFDWVTRRTVFPVPDKDQHNTI